MNALSRKYVKYAWWCSPVTLLVLLAVWSALPETGGAQEPEITVSTPEQGAQLEGASVVVEFAVTGLEIVPTDVPVEEAGQRPEVNRAGEGHVHLMLDLEPLVIWQQTDPYTFMDVPPGDHLLMVELVQNDHSSFSPPILQEIQFETISQQMIPATGGAGEFPGGMTDLSVNAIAFLGLALGLVTVGIALRYRERHLSTGHRH